MCIAYPFANVAEGATETRFTSCPCPFKSMNNNVVEGLKSSAGKPYVAGFLLFSRLESGHARSRRIPRKHSLLATASITYCKIYDLIFTSLRAEFVYKSKYVWILHWQFCGAGLLRDVSASSAVFQALGHTVVPRLKKKEHPGLWRKKTVIW